MAFNRTCFACSRVIEGPSSQVRGKDLCRSCFDLALVEDEVGRKPAKAREPASKEMSPMNEDELVEHMDTLLRSAEQLEELSEIERLNFLVTLNWELRGITLALRAILEREKALTVQNRLLLRQLSQLGQTVGIEPLSKA